MPRRFGSSEWSRRAFTKTVGLGAIGVGLAPGLIFARQSTSPVPQVKDPKYPQLVGERAEGSASASGAPTRTSASRFNRSNGIAVRNGRLTNVRQHRIRAVRRRGDVRLRRSGDSQRRVGLCQQSDRRARGDQARSSALATDVASASAMAKKFDVQAGAGQGVRHVLADADQGRPLEHPARGQGQRAGARSPQTMQKNPDVLFGDGSGQLQLRVEVPGDHRRLVHRAGVLLHRVQHERDGARDGQVKSRTYNPGTADPRLGVRHRERTAAATPSAWRPKRSSMRWPSRSAAG